MLWQVKQTDLKQTEMQADVPQDFVFREVECHMNYSQDKSIATDLTCFPLEKKQFTQ